MLPAFKIKKIKQKFQKFIENYNIDIIVVTETWLAPTDTLHLPNFDIIRRDRTPCNTVQINQELKTTEHVDKQIKKLYQTI